MNNSRQQQRPGWVKPVLLATIVLGSGVGGYFFSNRSQPAATDPPATDAGTHEGLAPETATRFQRFPLSALDVKDTNEAPDLAVNAHDHVFLAWASKTSESERTINLVRSRDGGRAFETPATIAKTGVYRSTSKGTGKMGYERRANPHVVADGATVHLCWGSGSAKGMEQLIATSTDEGLTFGTPRRIDREPANPTFTAFTAGPHGELACTWLSDRGSAQLPYASLRPAGAGEFEPQRPAEAGPAGDGVCPCCPTAAAFAPDGTLYVGYRNIHGDYRDIGVCRLPVGAAAFEGPFPVIPDTWKFSGCPHDGPSLVVRDNTLHVLWMDAHTGSPRCYHGWANVRDLKFEIRELHAGVPGSQGNARLAADNAGGLYAVWEESLGAEPAAVHDAGGHQHGAPVVGAGGGRAIAFAHLPRGQTAFTDIRTLAPKDGAFQTRPALAVLPDGDLVAAWNELDTTGKAVVAMRFPAHAKISPGEQP